MRLGALEDKGMSSLAELDPTSVGIGVVIGVVATVTVQYLAAAYKDSAMRRDVTRRRAALPVQRVNSMGILVDNSDRIARPNESMGRDGYWRATPRREYLPEYR